MEGLGRYAALFLHALRKDFKYWTGFALLCLALLFLFRMRLPDADNASVGVVYPDTPVVAAVFDRTGNEDNGFSFVRYPDESSLEQELLTGQLDCAFVFSDDFDRRLSEGNLAACVRYLHTPFTAKGALAKEYLYAGILQQYSPVFLKSEMAPKLQKEEDAAALEDLLEQETAAYLDSDVLFSVEVKYVTDTSVQEAEKQSSKGSVVPGTAAILLFVFLAFEMLERKRYAYAGYLELLSKKNRRYFCIASYAAESVLPYLVVTGLLSAREDGYSVPVQALKGIVCCLMIGIYILLLWILRLKKEYVPVTVLGLSLLWIVLNPVVTDFSLFMPAVRYLRVLTPVYWVL